MDILSDILQNSLLQNDAIERERGVILREEEEIAKSEEETTYDRLHSMAYQGTPLDKLILGRCGDPTTWTTIQQNGPHHLGLWHIALPEHQMALINSGCVPFSRDNISKITRDDLDTYIKTHYTAPRCVLVGAGAVDHDELVELANKAFASLPTENVDAVKEEVRRAAAPPAMSPRSSTPPPSAVFLPLMSPPPPLRTAS